MIIKISDVTDPSQSPYTTPLCLMKLVFTIFLNSYLIYFVYAKCSDASEFLKWIVYLICASSIFRDLANPWIRIKKLRGDSMMPTIKDGGFILSESISKILRVPYKRGDIIGLMAEERELSDMFGEHIMRITGLPGETLYVKSGQYYIGSELIEESWNTENTIDYKITEIPNLGKASLITYAAEIEGPIEVPDNCYFVTSDNRNKPKGKSGQSGYHLGFVESEHIFEKIHFFFKSRHRS